MLDRPKLAYCDGACSARDIRRYGAGAGHAVARRQARGRRAAISCAHVARLWRERCRSFSESANPDTRDRPRERAKPHDRTRPFTTAVGSDCPSLVGDASDSTRKDGTPNPSPRSGALARLRRAATPIDALEEPSVFDLYKKLGFGRGDVDRRLPRVAVGRCSCAHSERTQRRRQWLSTPLRRDARPGRGTSAHEPAAFQAAA